MSHLERRNKVERELFFFLSTILRWSKNVNRNDCVENGSQHTPNGYLLLKLFYLLRHTTTKSDRSRQILISIGPLNKNFGGNVQFISVILLNHISLSYVVHDFAISRIRHDRTLSSHFYRSNRIFDEPSLSTH